MSPVFYRKYRPQSFADIKGQNHIRTTIQNQIESNNFSHAYLFCGPRGVGKTTIARLVAKSLNCEQRDSKTSEPCNQCNACNDILDGKSMDVIEIDAASHTGVDHVRENIINNSRFAPTKLKYKIFIIDEVHMLSTSSFNALLKTLEEPPKHVIFILATTEAHKIPATIMSRCQRFDFKRILHTEMINSLMEVVVKENKEVEKGVLEEISRHSDGCLRDALSLLDQILSLGEKKITLEQVEIIIPPSNLNFVLDFLENLANKNLESTFILIDHLADEGVDWENFIQNIIDVLRQFLQEKIFTTGRVLLDYEESVIARLKKINSGFSLKDLLFIINLFLEKKRELKNFTIPQLALELSATQIFLGLYSLEESKKNVNQSVVNKPVEKTIESVLLSTNVSLNKINGQVVKAEEVKKKVIEQAVLSETINSSPNNESVNISLSDIEKHWSEIITKISERYQSLAIILKVGKLLEIKGNKLIIGFPFALQEKKLNELSNVKILTDCLKEFFSRNFGVVGVISDQAKINISSLEDMAVDEIGGNEKSVLDPDLASVLEEFGGKIVS